MTNTKRGFSMTYAVVLILIVSVLASLLLMTATLTSKSSVAYCNYVESKNLLDEIGATAVSNYNGKAQGATDEAWANDFAENKAGFVVNVTQNAEGLQVVVQKNKRKMLLVSFQLDSENNYQLKSYLYNVGVVDEEVS